MAISDHAHSDTCQVLIEDPELAHHLNGERLAAATREFLARAIYVPAGTWTPPEPLENMRFGLGLLILDGLVARRVGVAGRFGGELLGDGDIVRPWQHDDATTSLPHTAKWRALRPTRMAVLDSEFALRLTRYPEVMSTLFGRALRRTRHIAVNMAIVQQPRIDLRLHMLFWELADRWGRVRQDGVHVPLHLTHSLLADLVAARRPTVTKALGELAERGSVMWTGEDWLLPGDPPEELEPAEPVSVQATASAG
jgi:CRP/FNR family transcriptional regulator, cyclic AMP receptor protein